jgi:hypothetical protein
MWKAKTKDGNEVSELTAQWDTVKDHISELLLITKDNKIVYLPQNMDSYIQFKTASCELGSKNIDIESRVIGFKLGNTTVKIRVNEKTGNINIETN